MPQSRAICILGMHRSGTSLIARIANLLGVHLAPEKRFMQSSSDNPTGYWEHRLLTLINDEILLRLGGNWHTPPVFQPNWEIGADLADLRRRARALIREDFARKEVWGWKDPRSCLTLPFWKQLVSPVSYVICLRNPVDVCRSLERRDGLSLEKSARLWLVHVQSALQHTANEHREIFFYEDFIENVKRETQRLADFIGAPDPSRKGELQTAAQDSVDQQLQHYRTSMVDMADDPRLSLVANSLYTALRLYVDLRRQAADVDDSLPLALTALATYGTKTEREIKAVRSDIEKLQEQIGLQSQDLATCASRETSLVAERDKLFQQAAQLDAVVRDCHHSLRDKDAQIQRVAQAREELLQESDRLQGVVQAQQQAFAVRQEEANRERAERESLLNSLQSLREEIDEKKRACSELQQASERLKSEAEQRQSNNEETVRALLGEREARLAAKGEAVQLQRNVQRYRKEIAEKDARIANLQRLAWERDDVLTRIYQSHGWRALQLYYGFRDKMLPEGSTRRQFVKNVWHGLTSCLHNLEGLREQGAEVVHHIPYIVTRKNFSKSLAYAKAYGIVATWPKARRKLQLRRSPQRQDPRPAVVEWTSIDSSELSGQNAPQEDATVSVVIPTKDGGEEFRRVLAAITNQKGFRKIEIIVVDSGSTDGTVDISEEFGAIIIRIAAEQFTHCYARNLGAQHASGQYLLFTVQDALPPSDFWLHELYNCIKGNQVAAVSCAEFPSEGADLFYRAISWNHYRFLEVDNIDRIMAKNGAEDHISLRKNGQLSDLACLISKDLFVQYEYKTEYGEDLDLGIRLIKDGHKIAFLGCTKIIHSHNRSAYYYLRRGYVENLFVPKILPDYPVFSRELDRIIADAIFTHRVVDTVVGDDLFSVELPCKMPDFARRFVGQFEQTTRRKALPPVKIVFINPYGDPAFDDFMTRILGSNRQSDGLHEVNGILCRALIDFLGVILEYMEQTYEIVDEYVADEFRSAIYKAFTYQCGAQLAACFLKFGDRHDLLLATIHDELSKGV